MNVLINHKYKRKYYLNQLNIPVWQSKTDLQSDSQLIVEPIFQTLAKESQQLSFIYFDTKYEIPTATAFFYNVAMAYNIPAQQVSLCLYQLENGMFVYDGCVIEDRGVVIVILPETESNGFLKIYDSFAVPNIIQFDANQSTFGPVFNIKSVKLDLMKKLISLFK